MRPLRRHTALRRHARVAERVGALEVLEAERPRELLGKPRLLVDLDHATRAHDAKVGTTRAHPWLGLVRIRADDEDGVARADHRLLAGTEGVAEPVPYRNPAFPRIGRVERQLARVARSRIAIHGDAGRVRAPARHLD